MKTHSLAEQLKNRLQKSGQTVSVAESITGGQLQAVITSTSGASTYFAGGVTAYNIDQKVKLLGVDREHAAAVNCVSERVAREMAVGVSRLFGTDIGLATTGYAESCPQQGIDKPFAWIAISADGVVESAKVQASCFERIEIQTEIASVILAKLLKLP